MASSETDDIKQLSAEEKKQSREIILEVIGEKKTKPATEKSVMPKSTLGSLFGFKSAKEEDPVKPINQAESRQEINKILDTRSTFVPALVKTPSDQEVMAGETEKNVASIEIQPAKKIQPAIKSSPVIEKKQIEPTKKIKTTKSPQKKFFISAAETKSTKVPREKLGVYERRLLRSRHIPDGFFSFRDGLHENLQYFERRINIAVRHSLLFGLVFFIFLIISYAALIIVIIKGSLDNKPMRFVAHYIVVPALITKNGVVEYYDYLDIKNKLTASGDSAKTAVIKEIILNDLYRKLKISPDKSIDEVNRLVIADEDINKEALVKIRKINSMLKHGDDFISVGAKYSDELGGVDLDNNNASQYIFGDQVKDLQPNALSEIINGTNGYYIFKNVSTSSEALNLSYIYIKAKNLNDYLTETAVNYKAISFVD